jgi:23S rRNA pseudouridine1911/1915/1917 synthase
MEKKIIFAEAGKRLDIFLVEKFPQYSRNYFQKLINQGLVLVQSSLKRANYKLHLADKIEITFPPPEVFSIEPQFLPLEIIYEDKDIIVINKTAGMVVHPACGHKDGTLVNALLYHFKSLPGNALRPGLVHRLDKDTSGVMVIAKNEKSLNFLSKQFQKRKVEKTYLALVHGQLKEKRGRIEASLGRDLKNRKKVSITSLHSREAITEYKVRESFPQGVSLLEVKPFTGRTHQIRVHLSAIGHPVCGDQEYSSEKESEFYPRLMLHSWKLRFFHPVNKEFKEFVARLPDDFSKILDNLKREK